MRRITRRKIVIETTETWSITFSQEDRRGAGAEASAEQGQQWSAQEAGAQPEPTVPPVVPPQPDASSHQKRAAAKRRARRRHAGNAGGDGADTENR